MPRSRNRTKKSKTLHESDMADFKLFDHSGAVKEPPHSDSGETDVNSGEVHNEEMKHFLKDEDVFTVTKNNELVEINNRHLSSTAIDGIVKGDGSIEFEDELLSEQSRRPVDSLYRVQPYATKSVPRRGYRLLDLSNQENINVPVKSARTPYLEVKKKEMKAETKEEGDETRAYVEMAKQKEKIIFDQEQQIRYKTEESKGSGILGKLRKLFCWCS